MEISVKDLIRQRKSVRTFNGAVLRKKDREKRSVREALMRKGLKADERQPFGELFFEGSFMICLWKWKRQLLLRFQGKH